MPAYLNTAALPRQELASVVVEGRGLNKLNIHRQILPPMPINELTAHLITASIANTQMARIMGDKEITAPGTKVERLVAKFGDDTITVLVRKREIVIPDEVKLSYAQYLMLEAFFAQQGAESVELTTEYLTAQAIFSTGNFGSATNSLVAYTNANLATINVIGDIDAAIERGRDKGEVYNHVVLSSQVWQRIKQATLLKEYVVGQLGRGSEVTVNNLQRALADMGIEKVSIGSSQYNSAADGETPVMTRMWSNTYVWVGRTASTPQTGADAEGINVPTIDGVGVNAFWQPYTPNEGYGVDTYRDETVESNVVRTKTTRAPYIANTNAGDLIATQYA